MTASAFTSQDADGRMPMLLGNLKEESAGLVSSGGFCNEFECYELSRLAIHESTGGESDKKENGHHERGRQSDSNPVSGRSSDAARRHCRGTWHRTGHGPRCGSKQWPGSDRAIPCSPARHNFYGFTDASHERDGCNSGHSQGVSRCSYCRFDNLQR